MYRYRKCMDVVERLFLLLQVVYIYKLGCEIRASRAPERWPQLADPAHASASNCPGLEEATVRGKISGAFDEHQARVQRLGSPRLTKPEQGTLSQRLTLARRYYLARHGKERVQATAPATF